MVDVVVKESVLKMLSVKEVTDYMLELERVGMKIKGVNVGLSGVEFEYYKKW